MSMALRCDQLIEVDTVSIFVGKLNPKITDSELRERFSVHGRIIDCNMVRKHSKQDRV
jgi:RNA recognition motif-containing protein